jgi:serine/threonine protein kinase
MKSGLLEKNALDAYCKEISKAGTNLVTPREWADALIRAGMLTSFQAEKLLTGRWRGFLISGKYRLLDRLGSGGMGAVYLCEHVMMGRRVALKVLPINQAEDPASLARFYREARAVARLDHPNIVRAHDIDKEDKLHFLVLEFIDGCNLHEFVKRNGTLSVPRAAHYIRQAALGLDHANQAGLVHRDIKPGNLLLDRQGVVKVLDMGLARFFDDDGGAFVKEYEEGYVIGTADYLAPEQTVDNRVDIRADIYSLGGTLYYMLVGKSPFQDGTVHQKMIWHQVRQPKPVCCVRSDVPPELIRVLDKMMAKEPSRRFQTPGELIDALARFVPAVVPPPTPEEMPRQIGAAWGQSGSTATGSSSASAPCGGALGRVLPTKPGSSAAPGKGKTAETLRDVSKGNDTKINS